MWNFQVIMLTITDLKVKVEDKEILHGVNLVVEPGKVHALMGKNGSGKILGTNIMGHPNYTVQAGEVTFEGKNILEMDSSERAKAGLFLSFQYPSEVTGVNISITCA